MIKSQFIADIIDLLCDNDDVDPKILSAIPTLSEGKCEYTEYGFMLELIPETNEVKFEPGYRSVLDGVLMECSELESGAWTMLFVGDTGIALEIMSRAGDAYPTNEIVNYKLTQDWINSKKREIIRGQYDCR